MISRFLLGVFAVSCLHIVTGARFSYCDRELKYVEGYDDAELSCNVSVMATVRWTLATTTGATLRLGTCYGQGNCTTSYSSSGLRLEHYGSYANIRIIDIDSRFSGVLTCTEALTTGAEPIDTCPLTVSRASFRWNHQIEIREDLTQSVYCYNSEYTSSTTMWTLTTNSGQTLNLGNCTDVNRCTSLYAPNITLERSRRYRSDAYFKNTDRNKAGVLFCSYIYSGSTDTDKAIVNIYNDRPSLSNCRADLLHHNWSTILSCDITRVFSSSENYDFTVYQYFQVLSEAGFSEANSYVFDGRLSYRDMLTAYTDSTNNRLYYRGRLTYSWGLSSIQGNYTRLKVNVYYGVRPDSEARMDYRINISAPRQVTHNCGELNYIPETGVVPCVCTADYLGSPAGRLVWLLGNIIIATGDYGMTQLKFPSGKVSRQHDGMMVTCQLDWVQPMQTDFTSYLAYGPDNLTLQVIQTRDDSNNSLINVTSNVTGMKPMKADMVQWGGLCQGKQGFTCILPPRSPAEVHGKAVTCSVINAANNGHSAEASVVIEIPGFTPSDTKHDTKHDQFSWTAVALGIVLGIVLIAFVVVMVVLYRLGRLCRGPTQNPPTSQDEDDSHYYTSLKLSNNTNNKRNGVQQGVSCPSAVSQTDGKTVYENFRMEGQGGHM